MNSFPVITFGVKLSVWLYRFWKFYTDLFIQSSPQIIHDNIYIKQHSKKIDPILSEMQDDIQQPMEETGQNDRYVFRSQELQKTGNKYWCLAQLYWGKGSARTDFSSAWFYVLAAECHEHSAGGHEIAGILYHWAAHQFRSLGSYNRSIDYYLKSGQVLLGEKPETAARSLRRGIAVCKMCGDDKKKPLLESTLKTLELKCEHVA